MWSAGHVGGLCSSPAVAICGGLHCLFSGVPGSARTTPHEVGPKAEGEFGLGDRLVSQPIASARSSAKGAQYSRAT
jgi:hypothetical protein